MKTEVTLHPWMTRVQWYWWAWPMERGWWHRKWPTAWQWHRLNYAYVLEVVWHTQKSTPPPPPPPIVCQCIHTSTHALHITHDYQADICSQLSEYESQSQPVTNNVFFLLSKLPKWASTYDAGASSERSSYMTTGKSSQQKQLTPFVKDGCFLGHPPVQFSLHISAT